MSYRSCTKFRHGKDLNIPVDFIDVSSDEERNDTGGTSSTASPSNTSNTLVNSQTLNDSADPNSESVSSAESSQNSSANSNSPGFSESNRGETSRSSNEDDEQDVSRPCVVRVRLETFDPFDS